MCIDQLVETVTCVTQFEEHVCIFDVIANLIFDDPGAIYQS
jgi:hypothetical protein